MTLSTTQLHDILSTLNMYTSSAADFIISLLQDAEFTTSTPVEEIGARINEILAAMKDNPTTSAHLLDWANHEIKEVYAREILVLVKKSTGFQFGAQTATTEKLEALDIQDIARRMSTVSPGLWELVGVLLQADPERTIRRAQARARATKAKKPTPASMQTDSDGDVIMEGVTTPAEDDSVYWEDVDDIQDIVNSDTYHQLEAPVPANPQEEPNATVVDDEQEKLVENFEEREEALLIIKKIVCISIMMQSSNQKCNALQSLLGIFLHACNVPQTVVELMAHLGVSISTTAINLAVASLSKESTHELKKLGRTLLTSYAYDNVDMDLKHTVPTLEKPGATLIHLTSATLIPLEHGITKEDLNCSKELWEKSKLNRNRASESLLSEETTEPSSNGPAEAKDIHDSDFAKLHPDPMCHPSGLTRRERYNAWVFMRDLFEHGPEDFKKHWSALGQPKIIEQIPVVKSHQVHARMMDTPCSTPAENAQVIEDLLSRQAGVGDPKEDPHSDTVDVGNEVILVFGDLGVGERIQSVVASRSEETTPWRRMQYVVYGLGLFHVKMACADAIWRMFISKKESHNESDQHSLMKHVSILRPKETRKIETKPGFRRMHEIIQDVGTVSRLDCWRIEAKKMGFPSLEAYGASNPTFEELKSCAEKMCRTYVATKDFESMRSQSSNVRDKVNKNLRLRQQYFLLYDEITNKMNLGDIGGVETCFLPWIWLFQACGKHKYATYMRKYLRDVHFVYPEGLRRAVRMSILVNPTGKPGHFRGVDWWVEHNNLYIKRIYGGKFSNHTKHNILKESPLIGVFKNTRIQVERMFRMFNKTTRHSRPDMIKTFAKLATHLKDNKSHVKRAGRSTLYSIPNYLAKGQHMSATQKATVIRGEYYSDEVTTDHDWEDIEDEEAEVEELGDLED
ncbi:hypothetical protein DXG01_006485 [Tephrocybe rancida]|nr:hypothetical protein DXG01_006485 [Tephrocybe rancida]